MTKKTILVLINDADPVFARVARAKLEHETNWTIDITSSFDDVLDRAQKENPSLLITDLILSDKQGRSGFDLIESLDELGGFDGEVIVLTELAQDVDKEKAKKLGVANYFVKSEISIKEFADAIKKLLADN